jgi:hypothetical protein
MTKVSNARTSARGRRRVADAAQLAGALLLAAMLSACSSTFAELPSAVGGLPAGTPDRAATPTAYPAVHDIPPPRTNTVLTEEEQKKAAADLAAARDQQAKRASRDQ